MKLVWYSAPAVFAHARHENVYLSTHRAIMSTRYSESVMRSMGVPIADAYQVTQSRWDDCHDGLHYARNMAADHWGGQVAFMVSEVVLNTVFPTCGAENE